MAEKIKELGIVRDNSSRVYFVKGNPLKVVSAPRGRGKVGAQKIEASTDIKRDPDMLYYVGADGDLYALRRKGAR